MKYLFFVFCAIAFSCQSQNINLPIKGLSYLALGDSYTIGESVEEAQRYPVQLATELNKIGIAVIAPKIIAKTGWTTDELKAGIERANIQGQTYDMVSLLIGVNNQYRGRDAEQYRKEFIGLLNDAIAFAGGKTSRVFVVSIPDWGVTPFGKKSGRTTVSKEIDLYNAINKEETLRKGILYIDITPISRVADTDISLIAEDGLHPSGKMYKQWVDKILPDFSKNLK
ncbi:MAG: SGNH/GDSL hydrolase family protein [Spirosomataceae bacterium]